jgi:two-component system, OmpR family, sensor histidine kinase KdpD
MDPEDNRPDPDKLLLAIQQSEEVSGKGALKIFLGMAAGVGKTYAMLEAAQKLQRSGVNLVIGCIETHDRKETAALLKGLKIIPPQQITYKGSTFSEMNLPEILRIKPHLALVDELAHSNIPGAGHAKRWQDVVELLDNGIDVYTTLNVQHIESLKEFIESITGISIRETVPDSIIESATFIELIDLTPKELLERLKQGKVYLGDKSEIAALNFFQEDRLTALREIVLRYAAEKIDHDLHSMVSTAGRSIGWKHREKLLVAISHTLHSQKLIRTTRRLAFNLNAPWIALHVNDGSYLTEHEKEILSKNLAMARDLGAEVITIDDPDIAGTIRAIGRQHGVTQVVIGQILKTSFLDFCFKPTLVDELAGKSSDFDIHIVRKSPFEQTRKTTWIPSALRENYNGPLVFAILLAGVIAYLLWG